jgi:hypothetical protein
MNNTQKRIALPLIVFLLLASTAFATNWQQIKTFTGTNETEGYATDPFNVPGSEWRIDWSYVPLAQTQGSTTAAFSVSAYPKGETGNPIAEIIKTGSNETSGTTYIHQGRGDYYLQINVANTQNYTVTVQYDADSTAAQGIDLGLAAAIVLTTVAIIVAIVVIFKRNKKPQPRKVSSRKGTR